MGPVPQKIFFLIVSTILLAILGGVVTIWFLFYSKSPCLILEKEYCKRVEFISDPTFPGGLLAAYNLPPGTKIFAPIDGEFSKTVKFLFKNPTGDFVTYPGSSISVYKNRIAEIIDVKYSFIYFEDSESSIPNIKKGDIIGTVSDKEIDYLGKYNLAVRISKSSANGKIENESALLKDILQPK